MVKFMAILSVVAEVAATLMLVSCAVFLTTAAIDYINQILTNSERVFNKTAA